MLPTNSRTARGVTVVRPYSARIRRRMLDHLRRANLSVSAGHVVPVHASDEDAVRTTLELGNSILLVPFHARRSADGGIADGISFLQALSSTLSALPYRVLMPVSRFGAAGLELALASANIPLERVLVITEDELDDRSLGARIRFHVDQRGHESPQHARKSQLPGSR